MQSLLNFSAFVEPLHDPYLIIRARLAVLLYSGCFLNLVAGEPEVVFGHFLPR